MTHRKPTPPSPGPAPALDQAVVDLLLAERAFTQAYGDWAASPPDDQARRKRALETAERRIDAAEREVQRLQALDHEKA